MAPAPLPEAPARRRPFHYRRSLVVAAPPAELWTTIAQVGDYPRWWPWLRFETAPALLVDGTSVRAAISPPLPYALHLDLVVDHVDPGRSIEVTVHGDLTGPAHVEVARHPAGSRVTLSWDLRPDRRLLAVLAVAARPLLVWGHEWVIRTGATQFQRATGHEVTWTETDAELHPPRWRAAGLAVLAAAAAGAVVVRRRAR